MLSKTCGKGAYNFKQMNTLITGASGFVAQNLIPYLSKHKMSVKPLLRGDLSDITSQLYANSSAIVHLAGKAHDLKGVSNPDEYYEVNYKLTVRLYDEFLKSNAKKFIFISSVKASADSVIDTLKESAEANPLTHYGKSKLMAEKYIQAQDLPKGKFYYILRPCMIHGPGNKGNLNLLYRFVEKGIPYPLAAFDNRRSFLSVENLSFVIKELLETDVDSGVYNVADDDPLSTTEIVRFLAEASNKKAMLWKLPKSIIRVLASIGDKLRLPLNSERLSKLTENYIVSNEKIKKSLKKEFPLSSIEGIVKTAESFRVV